MTLDTVQDHPARDPGPVLCGTAFLMAFAMGLVNLGLVFHARETLGFSPSRVGFLPATHSLAYVAACLLLAPKLRPFSPRRVVLLSQMCLCICYGALTYARSYPWLLLFSALYGVSLSLLWPFLMGWMSLNREGKALGRSFSRYNVSWCGAMVFSPYVCGRLSEVDSRLPLWAAGALVLLAGSLVLAATRPVPVEKGEVRKRDSSSSIPGNRPTRLRYPAWLGLVVTFFGMGVFAAAFPLAAREDLGYSLRAVGLLLLVRALSNMLAFLGLGYTDRWHFRKGPMLFGQALGVVAFGGLVVAAGPISIALLLALAGVSSAFSYSISVFHGVSGASDRSTPMAIHEAMLATGLVFGSAGGAMLYDGYGLNTVFAVTAGLLLTSLIVQAGMARGP